MRRVIILCEGQAEEQFVNRILSPYFVSQNIFTTPVILPTKRYVSGGRERGGVSSYAKIANELRLLCSDKNAYITTMLDYFRLPSDTPSMNHQRTDTYQHVAEIEAAIDEDIHCQNCHANLIVHEYEALLFSEPSAFACIADNVAVRRITEIRASFGTPEDINSSPEAAPSKRILQIKPDYRKVTQGIEIAELIGINKIIASCPQFAEWISKIKSVWPREKWTTL